MTWGSAERGTGLARVHLPFGFDGRPAPDLLDFAGAAFEGVASFDGPDFDVAEPSFAGAFSELEEV